MCLLNVHLFISGRVQKVGFRFFAKMKAKELGLSGWVCNLPDNRVEVVVVGNEEKINKIIEWLHQGSPLARMDNVEIKDRKIIKKDSFGGEFSIKRIKNF